MPIRVSAWRWVDRLAVRGGELLDELADQGLGGVGGEAAGVAGGMEDVEEELGEALAVLCCGGGFVEGRDFDGGFEAGAGELVEADGDGLAEVHGEVAVPSGEYMGMVVRRVAWESWSLVRPVFSEPKSRATLRARRRAARSEGS